MTGLIVTGMENVSGEYFGENLLPALFSVKLKVLKVVIPKEAVMLEFLL